MDGASFQQAMLTGALSLNTFALTKRFAEMEVEMERRANIIMALMADVTLLQERVAALESLNAPRAA
jgi:hypothetical protein